MLPDLVESVTGRLILRPLQPRDARELLEVVSSSREELGRYMAWPREMDSIDQARRFVAIGREGWQSERTVRLAIVERGSGAIVGSIELDGIDRRRGQAELGYWIHSARVGRGYATEAADKMLLYAFDALALHKLRADVAVGNDRSASVLRRLGFDLEGTLREDRPIGTVFVDHWRFGLLRHDWIDRSRRGREPEVLRTAARR